MNARDKALSEEKGTHRYFLSESLKACDPDTGEKMTIDETLASSTGFMYNLLHVAAHVPV